MKKFLRFDAGRFNIWYAGALLMTGTAAVVFTEQEPSEGSLTGRGELPVLREIPETDRENSSREEKREAEAGGEEKQQGNQRIRFQKQRKAKEGFQRLKVRQNTGSSLQRPRQL